MMMMIVIIIIISSSSRMAIQPQLETTLGCLNPLTAVGKHIPVAMPLFLLTPKVRPRGICLFCAGVGVGWDVNVHVTLMMFRCSWGCGGVGLDVNVHVTLMMFRCSWRLG